MSKETTTTPAGAVRASDPATQTETYTHGYDERFVGAISRLRSDCVLVAVL